MCSRRNVIPLLLALMLFQMMYLRPNFPRQTAASMVTLTVKANQKKQKCALLFFGLPRNFKELCLPSIQKFVLETNPHCDVFAHSYNVTSMSSERSNEHETPVNIQDLYLLSQNTKLEPEADFWALRNGSVMEYRKMFPFNHSWHYPSSMDNMVKQWHSIDQVWQLMEQAEQNSGQKYDQVGLFRSDVFYANPINIYDGDAVIPKFGACRAANDRMFYGKREYAKIWATSRFDGVQGYIDRWRDGTQKRPEVEDKVHSEFYMRDAVLWSIPVPVKKKDICFFRVRGTGAVRTKDCYCHITRSWCRIGSLQCPSVRHIDRAGLLSKVTGLQCYESGCHLPGS